MKNNRSSKSVINAEKKPINPEVMPDKPGQKGQLIATAEHFAGPLPHPEIFRKYGEIVPDAPERILKVFEQDSEHTRYMQKAALEAEKDRDKRGQWMAFIIICAAFVFTGVCAFTGQAVAAILSGIASLILAFGGVFAPRSSRGDSNSHSA